jgi:superkiller protein 3
MEIKSMIRKENVLILISTICVLLALQSCAAKSGSSLEDLGNNPENHYQIGTVYLGEGNYLQAEMEFRKAIELNPKSPKYYNAMGLTFLFAGRPYPATEQFKKAISLAPNEPDFHNNLGTAYKQLGELELAKEEYRKVFQVTSFPAMFKTYYNMAQIYMAEKNWAEASHYLHKSIELNPNTPYTHNQLGIVRENQNNIDEALKHYRAALRIDSGFTQANYNMAVALFKLGRRSEAAGYFERVIEKEPDSELAVNAREFMSKIGQAPGNP